MGGFRDVSRRALGRVRPAATRAVTSVAAPTFATKDDLEVGLHQVRRDLGDGVAELRDAIGELRRLVTDDLDANAEVASLLGRVLAELRVQVDAIAAAQAEQAALLERLVGERDAAPAE